VDRIRRLDELRREVRREGFARLAEHLAEVQRSGDPVADLFHIGWAYHRSATANPNLYRVMFLEKALDERDATVGDDAFGVLVDGVGRCIASGRFAPVDPLALAMQLWALTHGLVTLELFGHLPRAEVLGCLDAAARNLFGAYGDDPRATGRSVAAARRRWGEDGD
jgi:Tetracyclin repressor-like, C-terminal domain